MANTYMSAARAMLNRRKTMLFICDVQERFVPVIPNFDKFVQNSVKLINSLKILNVPMIVTEQNPDKLGKTIPEFDISDVKGPFKKYQFSMHTPEVAKELEVICNGEKPNSIILMGLETHVCVENSAIDFRKYGYEVHIVADCCVSRFQEDRMLAFERMRDIGCHIATSENVIFKLAGSSNNEHFKKLLALLKPGTKDTGLVTKLNI